MPFIKTFTLLKYGTQEQQCIFDNYNIIEEDEKILQMLHLQTPIKFLSLICILNAKNESGLTCSKFTANIRCNGKPLRDCSVLNYQPKRLQNITKPVMVAT